MKSPNKTILLTVAIFASAAIMPLQAETVSIPNTFTAGTSAVAADVNANFTAVKSAVDGNYTKISVNTSDIGTNKNSILTNVNSISTNAGRITTNADDINALNNPVGYVSIAPAAFRDEGDTATPCNWYVNATSQRAYFNGTSNIECDAVAGIQIPDGVVVQSLSCTFAHGATLTNLQNVQARLMKVDLISYALTEIYTTPTTTNIGRQQVTDTTASSISNATIDNSRNAYSVQILFAAGNLDSQLTFFGCRAQYN